MDNDKTNDKIDLTLFFSFLLLLGFLGLTLSLTFSKGVCCGDDAYYAVIAKNLANGLGYTSSLPLTSSSYSLEPFDPYSGAGPTIILPASIIIGVFGNTYWAPGLANAILWFSTLVLIGIYTKKYIRGENYQLFFFTFVFLFLSFSLMAYHFEHWYALLGEIPAGLLIILGTLIFLDRDERKNHFLSGFIFSLAVQAKFLALAGSFVFIVVQMFVYQRNQLNNFKTTFKNAFVRILFFGIGFLIPLISFELWKLIILGPISFFENWREYLNYIGTQGAEVVNNSSLVTLIYERLEILWARFGISLLGTVLLLILAWLMLKNDKKLRYLFYVFCSFITAYSLYWLFFSNGWARYFIICLVILVFTLSLPLLAARPKSHLFVYFVLVVFFSSPNWTKLQYSFTELRGIDIFSPTTQTTELLNEAQYLTNARSTTDERILTITWSTAADLEYIMPTTLNFTTISDKDSIKDEDYFLAINTRFVDDKYYQNLLDGCQMLSDDGVYIIGECELSIPK